MIETLKSIRDAHAVRMDHREYKKGWDAAERNLNETSWDRATARVVANEALQRANQEKDDLSLKRYYELGYAARFHLAADFD